MGSGKEGKTLQLMGDRRTMPDFLPDDNRLSISLFRFLQLAFISIHMSKFTMNHISAMLVFHFLKEWQAIHKSLACQRVIAAEHGTSADAKIHHQACPGT